MRQASNAGPEASRGERDAVRRRELPGALQRVIADVVGATSINCVRTSVITHHRSLLGVVDVFITRLVDGVLVVCTDAVPDQVRRLTLMPVELDLPITEAARSGLPVIVQGRAAITGRYALLHEAPDAPDVIAAMPVAAGDDTVGVVSFWLDETAGGGELGDAEMAHLAALSNLCLATVLHRSAGSVVSPWPAGAAPDNVVRLRSVPPAAVDDRHGADDDDPDDDGRGVEERDPLERLSALEREVAAMRELLRFIGALTTERVGPD